MAEKGAAQLLLEVREKISEWHAAVQREDPESNNAVLSGAVVLYAEAFLDEGGEAREVASYAMLDNSTVTSVGIATLGTKLLARDILGE